MITIDNVQYRNLEEQVKKNMDDIKYILEEEGVLNQFGIKVVGQITSSSQLPDPTTYEGEFGDAYAVGTDVPYTLYIYTRANGPYPNNYWFNIGQFPAPGNIPGPQGPMGQQGEPGVRGSIWTSGAGNPSTTSGYLSNDKYLNTSDGSVYNFDGTQWQNIGSIRGPQGIQGIQGETGIQGIQGPQGPQGIKGDAGQSFEIVGIVSDESQLPAPSTLPNNQAYLVGTEAPYDMYVQVNEQWVNMGIVQGVQGPQGPQGPQGIQGPVGPTGPTGPTGPQGEGIDDLLNGTEIAKKAEQDAEGNNIVDTYAKKSELSYMHYLTVDLSDKFHFVCSIRNKSSATITSKSELLQAFLNIGQNKGISATGFLLDSTQGGIIYEVAAMAPTILRISTVSTPETGTVNTYVYTTASSSIGVQDSVPTL